MGSETCSAGASTECEEVEVWLVRDADDRRALHDFIAIERGDETVFYELTGWKPQSPVELILQAAGMTGGSELGLEVIVCDPASRPVKIKGFVAEQCSDLEEMLQRAFTGGLGGFHRVAVAMTGFHTAPMVFEYLRGAVGSPPVMTRHPALVDGTEAGLFGAAGLGVAADLDTTMAAIRALEGL